MNSSTVVDRVTNFHLSVTVHWLYYIGYVYTGPAEYLVGHILGQLRSRPKNMSLRHCVYTGPVSQVHDMRNA